MTMDSDNDMDYSSDKEDIEIEDKKQIQVQLCNEQGEETGNSLICHCSYTVQHLNKICNGLLKNVSCYLKKKICYIY